MNCLFAGDLLGQIERRPRLVWSRLISRFSGFTVPARRWEAMILGAMAAGAGYADSALGAGVEPFCIGRTAVPVSAGVWESETAVHNLDGDRVRVCDDRGK